MTDEVSTIRSRSITHRTSDRQHERGCFFYEEGLGLKRIGSFDQHEGYDGVMLGLPHQHVHLEITKHEEDESLPVPHPEQLLVFYIPDEEEFQQMKKRLIAFGGRQVTSTNPYWDRGGVTIEDPDGYRVVLMNTEGITPD